MADMIEKLQEMQKRVETARSHASELKGRLETQTACRSHKLQRLSSPAYDRRHGELRRQDLSGGLQAAARPFHIRQQRASSRPVVLRSPIP